MVVITCVGISEVKSRLNKDTETSAGPARASLYPANKYLAGQEEKQQPTLGGWEWGELKQTARFCKEPARVLFVYQNKKPRQEERREADKDEYGSREKNWEETGREKYRDLCNVRAPVMSTAQSSLEQMLFENARTLKPNMRFDRIWLYVLQSALNITWNTISLSAVRHLLC